MQEPFSLLSLLASSRFHAPAYYYMCPHTTVYMSAYYYVCVHIPPGADSCTHACEWGCNFTGSFDEVVRHEATCKFEVNNALCIHSLPNYFHTFIRTYCGVLFLRNRGRSQGKELSRAGARARHTHTHTHTHTRCIWVMPQYQISCLVCLCRYIFAHEHYNWERESTCMCPRYLGSRPYVLLGI